MANGIGITQDGVLVEIELNELEATRVSSSDQAKKIETSYARVQDVLTTIAQPFINTYRVLSTNVELAEAEIKLGLSFEAEGGIILVKSKGSANLEITIKLRAAKGDPSAS